MRKVKIIKSDYQIDYDGYYQNTVLYPIAGDWEEVTDDEYEEMQEAVRYANINVKNSEHYILIEYSETTHGDVFKSAKDFKEKMKKEKEKQEEAKEEAKRKRDEKALERKRKQLEKLKKELNQD